MELQIETKSFQNAEARFRINRKKRRRGRRRGVTEEEEFKRRMFFNKHESDLNQM